MTPGRRYVGQRVARIEDRRLLTGAGQYLDDIVLPGMLHVAFLRSPHAHARFRLVDTAKARAVDGVVAVLTSADLDSLVKPLTSGINDSGESMGNGIRPTSRAVLASHKVRHVGDAVAAVVACSRYLAEDACELIDVEWEPLPAVMGVEDSLLPDAPLVDDALADNVALEVEVHAGDVERAFAEASVVVEKTVRHGRSHAAPLEPRGVVADWSADLLTVWTSTQIPHLVRAELAVLLGLPEGRIRVVVPDVGGGFGLKAHIFAEELVIAAAARIVRRPIKWVEDRYENLAASTHAREMLYHVEAALAADGELTAFRARITGDAGAYSCVPYTPWVDVGMAANCLIGLYDVENVAYRASSVFTNKCQTGAYRGVGQVVAAVARESIVDDAARALDVDPVELRLRNCIPSEPRRTVLGHDYDGGTYRECLERVREAADHAQFRQRQQALREQGRYLGIGYCLLIEPGAFGTRQVRAHGSHRAFIDTVRVTVEPDGSVVVATGLCSNGQGHETSLAQVAADGIGVRLEDVRVVQADTETTPFSMGSRASRSAVVGGGATMRAAHEVRDKLLAIAAHALEIAPEDLIIEHGQAYVRGTPTRSFTIRELAQIAYFEPERRPASLAEPALVATRTYDPEPTFSNAAVAAIVDVDILTGLVQVERFFYVGDCGVMLNPMIVDGQVSGAVAQGLGDALLEEISYDQNGQLLSSSLMDFLYPSTTNVPEIEVHHFETPSPVTQGGIKGVGESGTIGASAALVNAVADALAPFGVVIDRTPMTPDYIRSLVAATVDRAIAPHIAS